METQLFSLPPYSTSWKPLIHQHGPHVKDYLRELELLQYRGQPDLLLKRMQPEQESEVGNEGKLKTVSARSFLARYAGIPGRGDELRECARKILLLPNPAIRKTLEKPIKWASHPGPWSLKRGFGLHF